MKTPFLNWLESQDIGPRLAEAVASGYNALAESAATAKLAKYLNRPATVNVKASSRTDLNQPAYNYFTDAREVNGVWAVHFTGLDAFEDIQESGFKNGTSTLDNLAYSANYSDSKRGKLGWLFALPLDCPYLDNYDLGYGDCGFLIKTDGVRARHIVDGDDEILFRGRDVLEKIPIIFDEDYDRWIAYLTDGKKLQNRSLRKLIQSAMKSLGRSEPASPPQEGLSALRESMMAGKSNALTEAGANRQSMPLPEEFNNTIVEGLKYAIRYGFITRHATEYQDRHGDMWSYQKSHAIAMKLLDAIKGGNPDVAMIAGPYLRYEDGSVRYQAYATLDWKNVIKIISTNTIFPPANPPKLKVWTCFCCDDPNEANKWVKKLAASVGKTLEPTNENGTHRKSANDVARSRGKFIYSEIVKKLSDQYKTDIAPRVRELMQEICRPAEQRDMGKVAELSNKIREIYAGRNELVKQRDEYAWKLFHKRPTDAGERHFAPMSPEELENCVTELHDLNVEREGILNKLGMVKAKLAELQAIPEDEIDRGMLGSLLKEKQEITEQRFRVEEKVNACRDRLFGGREGNISFGK